VQRHVFAKRRERHGELAGVPAVVVGAVIRSAPPEDVILPDVERLKVRDSVVKRPAMVGGERPAEQARPDREHVARLRHDLMNRWS
jgi:hypothetical protein